MHSSYRRHIRSVSDQINLDNFFEEVKKLLLLKYKENGNYTQSEKSKLTKEWNDIDWGTVYNYQNRIQSQLVVEYRNKNMAGVHRLQREILENKLLRICAIKRVTSNQGGGTPGVDGETWKKPWQRIAAVYWLGEWNKNKTKHKAKPVLRKWIPKANSSELRPLGIPTIKDRAAQCMYYYIMDPIVEETSDYNNYGFRKNRDPSIAIQRLWHVLNKPVSSTWIYDADIAKCFDRINHDALLKLCIVHDKTPLVQWLKAGIYDPQTDKYKTTNKGLSFKVEPNQIGTPQGGVISPMLCNVALNGLEEAMIIKTDGGTYRQNLNNKVHLVRYADDFVIIAPTKTALELRIKIAQEFLSTRGLEISPTKSKITTIYDGLNFLGFNIKKMKHKYKKQKHQKQHKHYEKVETAGYVLLITPTKLNIESVKQKIRESFQTAGRRKGDKDITIINLIKKLNPIVTGWRNYFAVSYPSIWTFQKLDTWILISKMIPWLRKLNRTQSNLASQKDIIRKYRKPTKNWKWRLGTKDTDGKNWYLQRFYEPGTHGNKSVLKKRTLPSQNPKSAGFGTDINPYSKQGASWWEKRATGAGYYDSTLTEYWSVYKHALVKYNHRCGLCNHQLGQDGEPTELHRIKPGAQGGKYTYKNVMPVHKFCHIKHHANAAKELDRFDTY